MPLNKANLIRNLKKLAVAFHDETCDVCGGTDWSEDHPGSGTLPTTTWVRLEWVCDTCGAEYHGDYDICDFNQDSGPKYSWIFDNINFVDIDASDAPDKLKDKNATFYSIGKKMWWEGAELEKKFFKHGLKKDDTIYRYVSSESTKKSEKSEKSEKIRKNPKSPKRK